MTESDGLQEIISLITAADHNSEWMSILFHILRFTWGKWKSSEETLARLHACFIGIFLIEFLVLADNPLYSFF